MKKDVIVILLMVIAVVFGVGLRYYLQNGSLLSQEPSAQEVVQSPEISNEMEEVAPSKKAEEVTEVRKQDAPDNEWGVALYAKDVTPDGVTLVCTQSGGTQTGELSTGAWYEIDVLKDGQWEAAPIYAEVCWEDIAWVIREEDTTQWEINWTWIYGTLPTGEYRIAKEIMDFRQTGDYDTCKSYAYFTIE